MEKYKILWISDGILPNLGGNAIVSSRIVKVLKKRGYDITCIAINQNQNDNVLEKDNIQIYNIKSTRYAYYLKKYREKQLNIFTKIVFLLLYFLRKVKNIINVHKFPNVDPEQSKRILALAKELHKKEEFDCIIGVFRPFSGIAATVKMKEEFPGILCVAYYLDLISGATKPSLIPKKMYQNLCYKGELRTFNKLDYILMVKGGAQQYRSAKYGSVNSKIIYTDLPTFNGELFSSNRYEKDLSVTEKGTVNLMYAGTLNKDYRNPNYMLEILKIVSKDLNIILNIYGSGNCNSIIGKHKVESSCKIIEHGVVPSEVVAKAMMKSDFVINISNSSQNMVPSKIFELFSTGKPIINFISNKNEFTKPYFSKYPSVCNIEEWENIEKKAVILEQFIYKEAGKNYPISDLKKVYVENTPEFTVELLENIIEKNVKKGSHV